MHTTTARPAFMPRFLQSVTAEARGAVSAVFLPWGVRRTIGARACHAKLPRRAQAEQDYDIYGMALRAQPRTRLSVGRPRSGHPSPGRGGVGAGKSQDAKDLECAVDLFQRLLAQGRSLKKQIPLKLVFEEGLGIGWVCILGFEGGGVIGRF